MKKKSTFQWFLSFYNNHLVEYVRIVHFKGATSPHQEKTRPSNARRYLGYDSPGLLCFEDASRPREAHQYVKRPLAFCFCERIYHQAYQKLIFPSRHLFGKTPAPCQNQKFSQLINIIIVLIAGEVRNLETRSAEKNATHITI